MTELHVNAKREAADILTNLISRAVSHAQGVTEMTDEEMLRGIDDKTQTYIRKMLEKKPELRPTLCRAARYRAAQAPRQARTKAKYVYFIRASSSGLIKIGSASNPTTRLSALQTGSPDHLALLGSVVGGEKEERRLHREFSTSRAHGEWFHPTGELMSYLKSLDGVHV